MNLVYVLPVLWRVDRNRLASVSESPLTMPRPVCRYYTPCHPFLLCRFYSNKLRNSKFNAHFYTFLTVCVVCHRIPRPCIPLYVPTSPISRSSTLNLQRFRIHVTHLYVYFCQSRKLRNIHARYIAEDNEYSEHLELWVAPSYHQVIHKAASDYHCKTQASDHNIQAMHGYKFSTYTGPGRRYERHGGL